MNTTLQVMYAVVVFVLPAVAVLAAVAMLLIVRGNRRRTLALHDFAVTHGFELLPEPPQDHLRRYEALAPILVHRSFNVNLIHGRESGIDWEIFDHRRLRGYRKLSEYSRRGVILARIPGARLPPIRIRPENFLHRVLDVVGLCDVQIGHEAFDRRYRLSCGNQKAARRLLDLALVEYLLAVPDHCWYLQGDSIVLPRIGVFSAGELPGFMKLVEGFASRIPVEFRPVESPDIAVPQGAIGDVHPPSRASLRRSPPQPAREHVLPVLLMLLGVGAFLVGVHFMNDGGRPRDSSPSDRQRQIPRDLAAAELEMAKTIQRIEHLQKQAAQTTSSSATTSPGAEGSSGWSRKSQALFDTVNLETAKKRRSELERLIAELKAERGDSGNQR